MAERTAATRSGAAVTQPTFQPVNENVLPAHPMVTVRPRIPGKVASGTCSASSKTRCSYTSSVTTSRSRSTASSAIAVSSSRVRTVPVGLCGVLISSSRVLVGDGGAQLVQVEAGGPARVAGAG